MSDSEPTPRRPGHRGSADRLAAKADQPTLGDFPVGDLTVGDTVYREDSKGRVTEAGRITPEHIRLAEEAVFLKRARELMGEPKRPHPALEIVYWTMPGAVAAMGGNTCAYGFEHDILQLQVTGAVSVLAVLIWLLVQLPLGRRR